MLVDMNFDGYLDLKVTYAMGAYNQSRKYWLYQPRTRRFVKSTDLENLLWPQFDPETKTIKDGGRVGGPVYTDGVYQWIRGKLETLESVTTYLGEDPQGNPLPAGYSSYKVRYKRVAGKLSKVFDGPVKPQTP